MSALSGALLRPGARPSAAAPRAAPRRASALPRAAAAGGGAAAGAPAPAAPLTDDAVPEGHRGLHADLYGDGGAEAAHGTAAAAPAAAASAAPYRFREGEDDGGAVLPLGPWLAAREGERPVGVFAVYDERRALQVRLWRVQWVFALGFKLRPSLSADAL
jgi:hypothetical protein